MNVRTMKQELMDNGWALLFPLSFHELVYRTKGSLP